MTSLAGCFWQCQFGHYTSTRLKRHGWMWLGLFCPAFVYLMMLCAKHSIGQTCQFLSLFGESSELLIRVPQATFRSSGTLSNGRHFLLGCWDRDRYRCTLGALCRVYRIQWLGTERMKETYAGTDAGFFRAAVAVERLSFWTAARSGTKVLGQTNNCVIS